MMQLRPVLLRELEHLVVVDDVRLAAHAVVDDRVEPAGEVDLEPVRQVAAVGEREREDRVARLQHAHVDGHVRLRAGVRLDVRVLGAEQRLRAVDRELLDLVDDLAAAVVALARIALGVLVRRHRADRLEHGRPGEVLGRDQLDLAALALELAPEQPGDLRVDGLEARAPELLERGLGDGHPVLPPRVRGHATRAPAQPTAWRTAASASSAATAPSRRTHRLVAGEVDHGRRDARAARRRRRRRRRATGSPPARPRAGAGRARRRGSRSWRRSRRRARRSSSPAREGRARGRRSCRAASR